MSGTLTRVVIDLADLTADNDGAPVVLDQDSYGTQRPVMRADSGLRPGAGTVTASTQVSIGDSLVRYTVTDARVTAASKILLSVQRNGADTDAGDAGVLFLANVVRVRNGSFDVLVAAKGWGLDDMIGNGTVVTLPSIELIYSIG